MKRLTTATAPCDQKRRSFLKLCGLLGLGAAVGSLLPAEQAEALLFGRNEYKVSATRLVMGSFLSITAIHPSRDQAENAIGLAWAEVDRLCRLLSRHDASTPLALLNREGRLADAPPELIEVVGQAMRFHRLTGGAFDVTVQPLVDLFKERFASGQRPTEAEITALLPRLGSQHLQMAGNSLSFGRPAMGITLDGIAPGYIVDRVSTLLSQNGVGNHLVNASGDIRTSGASLKGAPWTVAIQDPAKQKDYPDVVSLTSRAISTSGSYEVYYDQERLFHHIVNPQTGHSPRTAISVTTTAATVMAADALATGLMVMPPAEGLRLISQQAGCECFVIDGDKRALRSSGWSSLV